jgi:uncharacterized protein (TIGR02271 family)
VDKHDENVDLITDRPDGLPVGIGIDISDQPDGLPVDIGMGNGLAKVAIAGVVGAVVGTVAGALANKRTAQGVNRTFKGVGDAVKGAASGVNRTFKGVGDAIKGVASGFNDNVQGAGDAVKDTESGVNDTIKGAAEDVKLSVEGTVDRVKDSLEDAKPSSDRDVKPSEHQSVKLYEERLVADKKQVKIGEVVIEKHVETQTAHISVPVNKEQVIVEVTIPVDAGMPVTPGEANFHEGEVVRMEAYEETADIHKQAFVREEFRVRKQVEHNTVEVEDKIRREKLDLEIQGSNIIDNTKTV